MATLKEIKKKGEPEDSVIVLAVMAHQIQEIRVYDSNDLDKDGWSGMNEVKSLDQSVSSEGVNYKRRFIFSIDNTTIFTGSGLIDILNCLKDFFVKFCFKQYIISLYIKGCLGPKLKYIKPVLTSKGSQLDLLLQLGLAYKLLRVRGVLGEIKTHTLPYAISIFPNQGRIFHFQVIEFADQLVVLDCKGNHHFPGRSFCF